MSTPQTNPDFNKYSITELKTICKTNNIKGISTKKKQELIEILSKHSTPLIINLSTSASSTELAAQQQPQAAQQQPQTAQQIIDLNTLINKFTHADCVEIMQKIPSNSIDMVCTDPPYFLDGLGDTWNKETIDNKGASSLVGNLPKGMKFDREQSKKFYEFYSSVSKHIFRILKPGGAFISFSSPRLYHSMTMAIEEAGFEIRDMLGWVYTQAQVKAFSQDHIISKDKKMTEAQKTQLKELCHNWKTPQLKPAIEPMCLAVKPIEGRYIDNFVKYGTGLMNTSDETQTGEGYFPSNIITTDDICEYMDKVFMVAKPNKAEKCEYNTHLSVKPVNLIQHLIKLFTQKNAIVLDPFMGSGTTGVACVKSGRKYIGFDKNLEYIKISERRTQEAIASESTSTVGTLL